MTSSSNISKSMGYLLLISMAYNMICFAWCAVNIDNCCSKEVAIQQEKSCCTHEKNSDEQKGDCKNSHLDFFKALGTFTLEKSIEGNKVFFAIITLGHSTFNSVPVIRDNAIAYIEFHPPPLKADTRILIQSFQI